MSDGSSQIVMIPVEQSPKCEIDGRWFLNAGSEVRSLVLLEGGGLAAGTVYGKVQLWDSASLKKNGTAYATLDAGSRVTSLVLLEGGGLAAGTDGGKVQLWDTASLKTNGTAYATFDAGGEV